jgi:hypothetical protein
MHGSSTIAGVGRTSVSISIAIPDSAATGRNHLLLTVTRPDGLPEASGEGSISIQR